MATIRVDADRVTVTFSWAEKLLGLVTDVTVPRSCVRSVSPVESWWRDVHGWRVGLGMPGLWLLGTWRGRSSKQLVALRRGAPAVKIGLSGARYDELLISTPDAVSITRALAAH